MVRHVKQGITFLTYLVAVTGLIFSLQGCAALTSGLGMFDVGPSGPPPKNMAEAMIQAEQTFNPLESGIDAALCGVPVIGGFLSTVFVRYRRRKRAAQLLAESPLAQNDEPLANGSTVGNQGRATGAYVGNNTPGNVINVYTGTQDVSLSATRPAVQNTERSTESV